MGPLVVELRQAAVNQKVKVADLLRMALVVAMKLGVEDFKTWIENELHGYKDDNVPEYRNLHGEIKAQHPNGGWIPYVFTDPKTAEILSRRSTGQSIAQLEHLWEHHDPQATICIPFPPEVLKQLNIHSREDGFIPTVVIDRSRIYGVLDAVRTIVLEWSLKLEQNKILGDGQTFSTEEKERASTTTYNIQNFMGIAGNVQAEKLQIGNYNTIHEQLKSFGVPQPERNELENILDDLKTANPEQKKSLLRRGSDWLLRNGPAIGSLSETIRAWFEFLSR